MKRYQLLVILLLAFSLSACNQTAQAGSGHQQHSRSALPEEVSLPTRTVRVDANDQMRFAPEALTVQAGETILFQVTNSGAIPHEFVLGNARIQAEHAKIMAEAGATHSAMHHDKESNYALTIPPGKTASLTYTFEEPGPVYYGCHIPGHYAAGMKGAITIATAQ